MVKAAALAIAVTGLGLASAPRAAQAALLPIQTEAAMPAGDAIEQVQYRPHRHYRRHYHHRRHMHRHHRFHHPRHHHHRRHHHHHRRW
ncbi:hypothetical protein ACQKJ1_17965 [Methylorubrum rhodesianum]|uniref:hypothetical protein n=1 Tax=Methylorubrum rhodesianum TaxID=29427 RepID=UPI003CFD972A